MTAAVLKSVLFWLSRNRRLEQVAKRFGPVRSLTRRFVAGETLEDFLRVADTLIERGYRVIADHLGESVTDAESARRAADEYIRVIEALGQRKIPDPYISLKLTQLGLDLGVETARENLRRVLKSAQRARVFTRIDMESSAYVERTLQLYREFAPDFPALGIVLQSMLRRTMADAEAVIPLGANVRLVKGAYLEPASVAYVTKAEVNAAYDALAERLTRPDAVKHGVFVAIATHDPQRIARFRERIKERGLTPANYEFQMLYGIRTDLQERLRAEGEPVRIYVPYGSEWYRYLMRRMAERPANLWFVVKHLFRR
jgi:proline dehydrogenase